MFWRWTRRDLIAWSRTLNVRSTTELADELVALRSRMRELQHQIATVAVDLDQAPDADLTEHLAAMRTGAGEVHAALSRAARQALDLSGDRS